MYSLGLFENCLGANHPVEPGRWALVEGPSYDQANLVAGQARLLPSHLHLRQVTDHALAALCLALCALLTPLCAEIFSRYAKTMRHAPQK